MIPDLLDVIDGFWKNPSGWLLLLLVFAIVWLLVAVLDQRSQVTKLKQAQGHCLTASFLAQYTTQNNRRVLQRIRNSARRATREAAEKNLSGPEALNRFSAQVNAEIRAMDASFGNHDQSEEEEDDSAFSEEDYDDDPGTAADPDATAPSGAADEDNDDPHEADAAGYDFPEKGSSATNRSRAAFRVSTRTTDAEYLYQ